IDEALWGQAHQRPALVLGDHHWLAPVRRRQQQRRALAHQPELSAPEQFALFVVNRAGPDRLLPQRLRDQEQRRSARQGRLDALAIVEGRAEVVELIFVALGPGPYQLRADVLLPGQTQAA